MDNPDFKRWVQIIAEFVTDYKKNIENMDVSPNNKLGSSTTGLNDIVPDSGEEFGTIFEDFKNKIMPAIVNWNHPKFFSYYPSHNAYPSVLGDLLSAAIGGVGFTWSANPALTDLENLMSDWYAKLLHLPSVFQYEESNHLGGGCYQHDDTNALYNCILAARYLALERCCEKDHNISRFKTLESFENMKKFVIYTSEDAHDYVHKLCDAENILLRVIPPDENGVLTAKTLGNYLEKEAHLIPIMIIATLGTFSKFAVDEIEKLSIIGREHGCEWLHVDASYGGNALLLQRYQSMLPGLAYADSFVVNPSNWFQVGFDCTTLWIKDVEQYKKCFVVNPTYLSHTIPNAIDYRHYGIALSRRFRALKMWLTFRIYGKKGLKRRLRKYLLYTKMFADELKKSDKIVVIQQKYTFANFVLRDTEDKTNEDFLKYLNDTGKILLFPITLDGLFTLRFSVSYEHETTEHIKQAVDFIIENIPKFLEKQKDPETDKTETESGDHQDHD